MFVHFACREGRNVIEINGFIIIAFVDITDE